MAKKSRLTATEAAKLLTDRFNIDPPLPNKWAVIFRKAEELGHSARAMIANEGAVVQPPRNKNIQGQQHELAYITPEEGELLKEKGGAGVDSDNDGIKEYNYIPSWSGDIPDNIESNLFEKAKEFVSDVFSGSSSNDNKKDKDDKPASNANTKTVAQGDTLSEIAAKNNTTVEALLKDNPDIKDKNKIYVGQKINLSSAG